DLARAKQLTTPRAPLPSPHPSTRRIHPAVPTPPCLHRRAQVVVVHVDVVHVVVSRKGPALWLWRCALSRSERSPSAPPSSWSWACCHRWRAASTCPCPPRAT